MNVEYFDFSGNVRTGRLVSASVSQSDITMPRLSRVVVFGPTGRFVLLPHAREEWSEHSVTLTHESYRVVRDVAGAAM